MCAIPGTQNSCEITHSDAVSALEGEALPVPPRLWALPKNKTQSRKEQAPCRQAGTEAGHSRCQACALFVLTGQTWS